MSTSLGSAETMWALLLDVPLLVPTLAATAVLMVVVGALRALLRGRRRSSLPEKRFAEDLMRYMETEDGFDRRLGLSRHGKVLSVRSHGGVIVMEYKVPQDACTGGGQVGVGFVLALADLLTSLALIVSDADHRPGVSVSLTGELFDDISAGQTVVLRAAVSKVGANLGFTEMRVINTSGELLARVKHIKYLNMGSIWSFVGFLMPAIVRFQMRYFGGTISKGEAAPSSFESLEKLFSEHIRLRAPSIPTASTPDPSFSPMCAAHTSSHFFTGTPAVRNKFGFIHGGAISCAIEKCIIDHIADSEKAAGRANSPISALHFLEISFLSPCKGSVEIDVETHSLYASTNLRGAALTQDPAAVPGGRPAVARSRMLPRGSIAVTVRQPKKHKPLAEAVVSF